MKTSNNEIQHQIFLFKSQHFDIRNWVEMKLTEPPVHLFVSNSGVFFFFLKKKNHWSWAKEAIEPYEKATN